jgi:PAS domain S-box-containing protein
MSVAVGVAFLVLISLVAGVGYLGLDAMDSLHEDARSVAGTQWTDVQMASEALTYSNQNSRITTQIFLTDDLREVHVLLARRADNSAKISAILQQLQSRSASDKERALLNAIVEARTEYTATYDYATDFLLNHNTEEARRRPLQQVFPRLLKYHAAWADFVSYQTGEMDKQLKRGDTRYAAARKRTFFLDGLALLLALSIAAVVVPRLMSEVVGREEAEWNLRGLNEELEVKVLHRTASLDQSNRDLTAEVARHREAEEAKSRSDQLFRSIAESSADLIAVVDQSGHRIYNNPAYERLLGYTAEELKSTVSFQQIHPDDRAAVTQTAQRAIETGVGQSVEYRMQRKDGTYITLESHGSFIRDSKGEIQAFVISARDVSARRMAMQTEKLSAIGQLAAGIAHELNTPVQYISDNITFIGESWAQLEGTIPLSLALLQASAAAASGSSLTTTSGAPPPDWDWLRQEVPRAIVQSREGIRRMTKILGAMRRFSHTGGGEREHVDLNEALDATLTVVQNQIKHLADVETNYQPDLPRVECYSDELNQVFLNLIVNAAHAIRDASIGNERRGRLTIRTSQIGDMVQIEVQDNGTGIPLHARAHVFDPFFTTKQVGEGTGQGLSICHDIVVHKHHGKIWFDTEIDKGTTFFVTIPIHFVSDTGDSH